MRFSKALGMYRNIVFDLYGTLVDIHTDETRPRFWRAMAALYSGLGAEYSGASLRKNYLRLCAEEEAALQKKTGADYPEIELRSVFKALLESKQRRVKPAIADDEKLISAIALTFRTLSRDRLRVYEHTHQTLAELKRRGASLYMLSNAQAVFTETELELTALRPYFSEIRLSSDHGIRKPQPDFLRSLLNDNGLDPAETVMIGNDVLSDMKIADECGVDGILLNTDGLDDSELARRIRIAGIRRPEKLRVIRSGDIAELLNIE